MPVINALRLRNVGYGEQGEYLYDDFKLELFGESSTYQLGNARGKTFLFKNILKVMLPEKELDEREPMGKIFKKRPSENSHVLLEWKLDREEGNKYLLIGMAMRKKKEKYEGEESFKEDLGSKLDYFIYAYEYSDENYRFSLRNLPMSNKQNTALDFSELKDLFKRVREDNVEVYTFSPSGYGEPLYRYYDFLKERNIVKCEWELMLNINLDEAYVEKYFKQFRNSRALVEKYLLNLIIELDSLNKGKANKESYEEGLASTLLQIRSKLNKLLKDREMVGNYQELSKECSQLKELYKGLTEEYSELEQWGIKAIKNLNLLQSQIKELSIERDNIIKENNSLSSEVKVIEDKKKHLEIQEIDINKKRVEEEYKVEKEKLSDIDKKLKVYENLLNESKAQKHFETYKLKKNDVYKLQERLKKAGSSDKELYEELQLYGNNLKALYEKDEKDLRKNITAYERTLGVNKEKLKGIQATITKVSEEVFKARVSQENLNSKILQLKEDQNKLNEYFIEREDFSLFMDSEKKSEEIDNNIVLIREKINGLKESIKNINEEIVEGNGNISSLKESILREEFLLSQKEGELKIYEEEKASLEEIKSFLKKDSLQFEEVLQYLNNEKEHLSKEIAVYNIQLEKLKKKLKIIREYNTYIPMEELVDFKNKLKEEYKSTTLGIEEISKLGELRKKRILEVHSYLPFGILMEEGDYKAYLRECNNRNYGIEDAFIPILNKCILEEDTPVIENNSKICFNTGSIEQYINEEGLKEYSGSLSSKIRDTEESIKALSEKSELYSNYKYIFEDFLSKYPSEKVEGYSKSINTLKNKIKRVEKDVADKEKDISDKKDRIENLSLEINREEVKEKESLELKDRLNKFIFIKNEESKLGDELIELRASANDLNKTKENYESTKDQIEIESIEVKEALRALGEKHEILKREIEEVKSYLRDSVEEKIIEISKDECKNKFEALKEEINSKTNDLKLIENSISTLIETCSFIENTIEELGFSVEYFEVLSKGGNLKVHDIELYNSELGKYKNIYTKQNEVCEKLSDSIKAYTSQIDLLKGKLESEYREENLTTLEEINDYREKLFFREKEVNKLIKNNYANIKSSESKINELLSEKNRFEVFLENKVVVSTKEVGEKLLTYKDITKEYGNIEDKVNGIKEKINKLINELKDNTVNYNVHGFKSLIESTLNIPSVKEEVEKYIISLENYEEILKVQIQGLEEDISYIEKAQSSFIDNCYQRAVFLLSELKKIGTYSKIKMYGKNIKMIDIVTYDYSENICRENIERYINKIVLDLQKENKEEEDLLKSRLQPKNLLEQVTDMDKFFVKLYKLNVEDHNMSTMIKWKYASGSGGQRFTMYFTFAICILSFIKEQIAIKGGENSKVVIADNPFGPTSDAMLWDAIFNILGENKVQLIAFGHNIDKKNLQRFPVNYVLNGVKRRDGKFVLKYEFMGKINRYLVSHEIGEQESLF